MLSPRTRTARTDTPAARSQFVEPGLDHPPGDRFAGPVGAVEHVEGDDLDGGHARGHGVGRAHASHCRTDRSDARTRREVRCGICSWTRSPAPVDTFWIQLRFTDGI